MVNQRRTRSYLPLDIQVGTASQMIIPPMASEVTSENSTPWAEGTTYGQGDLVLSNRRYYWKVAVGDQVAGATAPDHADGDATDGTITWRAVRSHRDVLSMNNISAGTISIARGVAAELNKGITLGPNAALNEGYEGIVLPYEGAWYAIADSAGLTLTLAEG